MTELEKLDDELGRLKKAHPDIDLSAVEEAFNAVAENYKKTLPEPFQRIGTLKALATNPKTIIDVGVQSGRRPSIKRSTTFRLFSSIHNEAPKNS